MIFSSSIYIITQKRLSNKSFSIITRKFAFTINLVSQKGFEPLTPALEGRCSIQLSYWDKNDIFFKYQYKYIPKNTSWQAKSENIMYFLQWEVHTISKKINFNILVNLVTFPIYLILYHYCFF